MSRFGRIFLKDYHAYTIRSTCFEGIQITGIAETIEGFIFISINKNSVLREKSVKSGV